MPSLTIQHAFDLALQRHKAGRLQEAEQLYRQIVAQQPDHADAIHLLGVIAQQVGRHDEAVDLIRRAIAIRPGFAQAYSNLGMVLKDAGEIDAAIAACRQAIALMPGLVEAHHNLGVALHANGQADDAIAEYRLAVAINPQFPKAHTTLGNALRDKGQLKEAIAAHRRAIALDPNLAEAHHNLGMALKEDGLLEEAIAEHRRAIALNPNVADTHNNLGIALRDRGLLGEAIAAYRKAIACKPDYAEAFNNLGVAFKEAGELEEAIAAHRQAIALRPDYAGAYDNLGVALKDKGELDDALAAFRHAIALNPDLPIPHSNLLYTLHYHPGCDAGQLAEEHRRWNLRHARPLRAGQPAHANERAPERRLRIGYVSPDFREHPVGRFLKPLIDHHDRDRFEIFCYSDVPCPDAMTERFRIRADVWRDVYAMRDESLAALIRQDRIDILVDLAMHTGGNRLLVFARKPAPVQVTYLAYCSTTGLDAIDYRLTDPHLDRAGMDQYYSEKSIRLPDAYWCYDPGPGTPEVAPLPAFAAGHVTFGCLNNFAKVSPQALSTWMRLLEQLPTSRFLLHARRGNHRSRLLDQFKLQGIDPARLIFVDFLSGSDYLRQYHQIDIALDPFPFAGATTTCDALWMGAPVITLAGRAPVGRAGVTLLHSVGLDDLVAKTPEQYVQLAADLAADLPHLAQLRTGLRARMLHSPLMDAPRFARNVEAAYHQMWRKWCESVESP